MTAAFVDLAAIAFYCCVDYLVLGAGCQLVVDIGLKRRWARISGKAASLRQVWKEINVSLVASAVGTGSVVFLMGLIGHRNYFANITAPANNPHGFLFSIVTIAAAFLFFDLAFYLSHRFVLHSRLLYKRVHSVHHQFHAPTPWARCAFSWVEQALYTVFALLPSLIVPMNLVDVWISVGLIGLAGMYHHLGYEIVPAAFAASPLRHLVTTPTHHGLHHTSGGSNFSLIVNYDYVFGCQNPRYEAELARSIRARAAR